MKDESVGRPTLYKPEYCKELLIHMQKGLSFEAFAGKIGVCRQTLYTWAEKHPEFIDAKKIATEMSRLFWEEAVIERLHDAQGFNTTAWIFNMKNRFGWRDKVEQEIKATGTIKIETQDEHL